jgi:hypothetical protein
LKNGVRGLIPEPYSKKGTRSSLHDRMGRPDLVQRVSWRGARGCLVVASVRQLLITAKPRTHRRTLARRVCPFPWQGWRGGCYRRPPGARCGKRGISTRTWASTAAANADIRPWRSAFELCEPVQQYEIAAGIDIPPDLLAPQVLKHRIAGSARDAPQIFGAADLIVLAMTFFQHAGYARRRLLAGHERTKYVLHDGVRLALNGCDRLTARSIAISPDG